MRSPTSTTTSRTAVEQLAGGAVRVSSRFDIDELDEIFDVEIEDEDVETVGGLMAKHLGRVPIPGAEVECEGLHFQAESLAGRRNKVVTVVVTPVESDRRPRATTTHATRSARSAEPKSQAASEQSRGAAY